MGFLGRTAFNKRSFIACNPYLAGRKPWRPLIKLWLLPLDSGSFFIFPPFEPAKSFHDRRKRRVIAIEVIRVEL